MQPFIWMHFFLFHIMEAGKGRLEARIALINKQM